ncbi:hypothetical protein BH23CHL8_BH23CHL8_01810 [soil metagenome]
MRLLLDEHYSTEIAESLRRRGHDVVGVAERRELRSRRDIEILTIAAAEGRVVVTEDVRDFAMLGSRRLPTKRPHRGILLVSQRAFPRSRAGFGLLVRALHTFLAAHAGDDELVGEIAWLVQAPEDQA